MKRQNLRTVSLCVFTLTYLLIGAAIFGYLESETEVKQREALDFIERTIRRRYNISDDDYSVLYTTIIKSAPHKAGTQWKFPGAFYFATTVVTTIGYGHSTPSTIQGRSFCMLYALVGVPLGLVMFQCIGERLNALVSAVLRKLKRSMKAKNQDVTETNKVMVVSVLSTILMTSMAAVFSKYEQWEYFDALYYCFITLTTIGFGDFVALQKNSALQQQPEYVVLSLVFILFGLSVVSSAVNLLVLKFLTLNTEDERRDEMLRSNAAQNPILLEGDVITSSAGKIEYVGGSRAAILAAGRRPRRRPSIGRDDEADDSSGSGDETAESRPLNIAKNYRPRRLGAQSGTPVESAKNETGSDHESGEDGQVDEPLGGGDGGSQIDLASEISADHLCDCHCSRQMLGQSQWVPTTRTQQLKSPASDQLQMLPSPSPGTKSAFGSSDGSSASFTCAPQATAGTPYAGPKPTDADRTWLHEAGCNCDDNDEEDDNQPEGRADHCQRRQKCRGTSQLGYQHAPVNNAGICHEQSGVGQRRPHLLQAAGANQSSCSCSWVSLASDCVSPPQEATRRRPAASATTKSNESLPPRPFLRPTRIKANAGGCSSSSSLSSCLLLDPGGLVHSHGRDRARGPAPCGRGSGASLKRQVLARLALRSSHECESQGSPPHEATSTRRYRPASDAKLMLASGGGQHEHRRAGQPNQSACELAHGTRATQLAAQIQRSELGLMSPVAVDQDAAGVGVRQGAPDICSLNYANLAQRQPQLRKSYGSTMATTRLVCRCCCQHAECIEFAIGTASKERGDNADNYRTNRTTVIDGAATFPEISRTFQQIAPPSPIVAGNCDKGGAPETNTPRSPLGQHSDSGSNFDGPQEVEQAAAGALAAPNSSCDDDGSKLPTSTIDENCDTYNRQLGR